MSIYEFSDYKVYVRHRVAQLPKRGRGELSRIAEVLGVHTTMVTHVLRGEAHLNLEQALKLADHLALNELETDYFVALVQLDRAGDRRARDYCRKRIDDLLAKAAVLKERLGTKDEMNEADRALFYSSWPYMAVMLLTSVERFFSAERIAQELNLPLARVREILEFLLSRRMCVEENGKIRYGGVNTYLEAGSPLVVRHHQNWRQKTQAGFDRLRNEDLAFTYPVTLSEKDFLRIREKLVLFISEFRQITEPSPADDLYCLNIDWIKVRS